MIHCYKGIAENNERYELPSDYADMFGWEEQVKSVDNVYHSPGKAEREFVEHVLGEVEPVNISRHPFAIDDENVIPLFLCRIPKVDIELWWREDEPFIFD